MVYTLDEMRLIDDDRQDEKCGGGLPAAWGSETAHCPPETDPRPDRRATPTRTPHDVPGPGAVPWSVITQFY